LVADTHTGTLAVGLHIWRARIDGGEWRDGGELPEAERKRAAALTDDASRRRWVAARWALRTVLAEYLDREPASIELCLGEHGKPRLAEPSAMLRFNLSHSGEVALIAVAKRREVGVDVQRIGTRRPPSFYAEWTRREAIAKCHGVSLEAPLPNEPVTVSALDAGHGFAASVAIAGNEMPTLRQLDLASPQ
jgi:phosphopantetheinyl transferase